MTVSSPGFEDVFGVTPSQIGMLIAGLVAGFLGAVYSSSHPYFDFALSFSAVTSAWTLFARYPVVSLSIILITGGLLVLIQ